MTAPGGTTSYDYEDRLTAISYPSTTTNAFAYSAFDTRVGKTDSVGTATLMRDGVGVCSPVLSDGNSSFTPGVSQRLSTFQAMDRLGTFSVETNASDHGHAAIYYPWIKVMDKLNPTTANSPC